MFPVSANRRVSSSLLPLATAEYQNSLLPTSDTRERSEQITMLGQWALREVRMFERLFGGDALLWVVGEELGEEVEAVGGGEAEGLAEG